MIEGTKTSGDQNPPKHETFMNEAIQLAIYGVKTDNGRPFGSVVVKDGEIVGRGNNKVFINNDPSAHAEVMAIRDACKNLNTAQLDGCVIYTSCEPCPMCLGAIYWARLDKVYFGCNQNDAANVGFDDAFIYKEIELDYDKRSIPFQQVAQENALKAFKKWSEKKNKIDE